MKILLFGKNGQVGWELNRSLQPLGEVIAMDKQDANFTDPDSLREIIRSIKPDVIVNAVAYTAVDKAEEEESLATIINGTTVGVIAEEVKKLNALLIHYSTDYVFDGSKKTPYTEDDMPCPINAYGRSKLDGEDRVRSSRCKYLIFRTSWVYAARGSNFLKTMFRLATERDELKVVADQFGAPTSAELIADVTALTLYRIISNPTMSEQVTGLYHLTASGKTSWYGYARLVLEIAVKNGQSLRVLPEQVTEIMALDYPVPAKRPVNSILSTNKLCSLFEIVMPPWTNSVKSVTSEIIS